MPPHHTGQKGPHGSANEIADAMLVGPTWWEHTKWGGDGAQAAMMNVDVRARALRCWGPWFSEYILCLWGATKNVLNRGGCGAHHHCPFQRPKYSHAYHVITIYELPRVLVGPIGPIHLVCREPEKAHTNRKRKLKQQTRKQQSRNSYAERWHSGFRVNIQLIKIFSSRLVFRILTTNTVMRIPKHSQFSFTNTSK